MSLPPGFHVSAPSYAGWMAVKQADEKQLRSFPDAEEFRRFVAEAGSEHPGIWLKISKKGAPVTTLGYEAALDVALAFGWIDGQKRPLDEHFWLQAFTPRRPRSVWSKRNVEKAKAMIASGEMQPDGLAQVEAAKADGRWDRAYAGSSTSAPPAEFLAALELNADAKKFYATLNAANRFAIYYRLTSVKREETRQRKIIQFVEMLARGEKSH